MSLVCARPAFAANGCASDCNGDGVVVVHELVIAVCIALEDFVLATCPAADAGADGRVSVNELTRAVRHALDRCPPAATPAATATAAATASATRAPSFTPTATATATATASETATATPSATPTASATWTASDTATPSPTATPSATDTATATPTGTASAAVTGTASATVTFTEMVTSTATATATASETPTATPTATEVWISPTATASVPPDPMSVRCVDPDRDVTAAADKVAAQTLRWLRDWANCLGRAGYRGDACEVRLGIGPNHATVRARTGGALINELVCNEARCTQELGRSLAHCEEKLTYQAVCSLADWENMWRWSGNPPLPRTGTCDDRSQASCLDGSDCAGGTCVRPTACDVWKYAPDAWEPCRCIQEAYIAPQLDEWLAALRALPTAPSAQCAAAAFNTMGEAIGPMIELGCMEDTASCTRALTSCDRAWAAASLKSNCGTCALLPDGTCPASCVTAQIPCTTWMDWCASANARFDPLRRGTRGHPAAAP